MLTNTKSATNPNETYTWDAVGNRLTSSGSRPVFDTAISSPTPPSIDYSYSDGYRLSSDTVYTYTYDAEGNTVSKAYKNGYATWTYAYDGEDRMTAAALTDASGTVVVDAKYAYDLFGRRISKSVNGAVTRYAYIGLALTAEYEGTSTEPTAKWFYGPGAIDHPVAMERGGQMFYYVYDERGSVAAITNSNGDASQKYEYDSFGRITLTEGRIANPFAFTGREFDPETGLYYFRARYYDPDTGRFLRQDPVFALNLYPYANGDPVNNVDPLGLTVEENVADAPGGGIAHQIKGGKYHGDIWENLKDLALMVVKVWLWKIEHLNDKTDCPCINSGSYANLWTTDMTKTFGDYTSFFEGSIYQFQEVLVDGDGTGTPTTEDGGNDCGKPVCVESKECTDANKCKGKGEEIKKQVTCDTNFRLVGLSVSGGAFGGGCEADIMFGCAGGTGLRNCGLYLSNGCGGYTGIGGTAGFSGMAGCMKEGSDLSTLSGNSLQAGGSASYGAAGGSASAIGANDYSGVQVTVGAAAGYKIPVSGQGMITNAMTVSEDQMIRSVYQNIVVQIYNLYDTPDIIKRLF